MATKFTKSKVEDGPTDFTQAEKNKIVEKLVTARIGLLLRHPFFGNMSTRLELVDATDSIKTLATDGRRFFFNNDFVNKLSIKEAEFGFAHEILHNCFDHIGRAGLRDRKLANIAADYAVNQILVDDKIGEVPKFIQIYQDNKYRSKSFEEIYDELVQQADKNKVEGAGEMFDEHLESDSSGEDDGSGEDGNSNKPGKGLPSLSEEDKKQIRDEIREAMISAAQSAGKVPASIQRMIAVLTEPKMDWREILRMNIQSILKSNFSFTRPNRKSQMCGAILPGMTNDETIDVSVAIDMSGSISDAQAHEFISEVKGIMDEYVDFKLDLWTFDTKCYGYKQFTASNSDEITEYKCLGGGGTNFVANWDFMKANGIEPKRFIMFTDMMPDSNGFGDPEYCDTLFVGHGAYAKQVVAPFGTTCHFE